MINDKLGPQTKTQSNRVDNHNYTWGAMVKLFLFMPQITFAGSGHAVHMAVRNYKVTNSTISLQQFTMYGKIIL